MADALTLSRLGLGGFGNNYGGGYNGAFDEVTYGGSLSDTMNLFNNNYMMPGMTPGMDTFSLNPMSTYGTNPYMTMPMTGMGMGMGMGFMPSFGGMGMYGMTPAEYKEWQNMSTEEKEAKWANIQENRLNRQAEQQERFGNIQNKMFQRTEERRLNRQIAEQQRQNYVQGPLEAAKYAAVNLKTVIQNNRKDEVMQKFSELKTALSQIPQYQKSVKNADGTYTEQPLDEKEMNAKARQFYAQVTGCDLIADVEKNLSGSFAQGIKTGLTFGIFGDTEDANTLTEKTVGLSRDGSNVAARTTGRVLGGATTGAAAGAAIGACFGGVGAVPGAIIGGLIGGASGLISSFF